MRHGKRKMVFGLFIVVMICVLSACGSSGESEKNTKMHSEVSGSVSDSTKETGELVKETGDNKTEADASKSTEQNEITITVGDTVFPATLADNSSADALKELLAEGPLTIDMSDYGNMEKVGPIGFELEEKAGLPDQPAGVSERQSDLGNLWTLVPAIPPQVFKSGKISNLVV